MEPFDYQQGMLYPILENLKLTKPAGQLKEVRSHLDYLHFFILNTVWALEDFKEKKFAQFDALVGETACQIRASEIANLAQHYLTNKTFQNEVDQTLNYFKHSLKNIEKAKELFDRHIVAQSFFKKQFPQGLGLSQFCKNFDFQLNVSSQMAFIVESHLLCQTKKEIVDEYCFYSLKEVTDLSSLLKKCEGNSLGKNSLNKLVQEIQRHLAQLSVHSLFTRLKTWPENQETEKLKQILEHYTLKDDFDRACTPCFYNMPVIWKDILKHQHPLVLNICRWTETGTYVDNINLVYKVSEDGLSFVPCMEAFEDTTPVIFLHAVSVDKANATRSKEEYLTLLNSRNLMEIFDVNWAQHTQLPGKKNREVTLPVDPQRDKLKELSHEIGCSHTNKSLFLAIHMFCDNYKQATNKQFML